MSVTYRCTKCKAEDSATEAHPPQVLNCWKCGAGRGLEISDMLKLRTGMFPVAE